MNRITKIALASSLLLGTAAPSIAHHSASPHFDNTIDITVEGLVTEWKFVNPHSYIYLDVEGEDGKTSNWRFEHSAAASLLRSGFTKDTFVPGQKIKIFGNPARREANVGLVMQMEYDDGTLIERNSALPEDKVTGEIITNDKGSAEGRPLVLANGQPNLSGYWVAQRPERPQRRPEGAEGDAMGAGMARGAGGPAGGGGGSVPEDATQAAIDFQANYEQPFDDPSIKCRIGNIFFGWGHDQNVNQITQEDNTVTMTYGYMDAMRTIHLDKDTHPENIVPSDTGHSIGKWEGDTLIVNTIGFLPGVQHPIQGWPFSKDLEAVERIRYNPETETLDMSYAATDPVYYNTPITDESSQIISARPYTPYDCVELSGINNLRPGTPEYIAAVAKANVEAGAGAVLEAGDKPSGKLWIALLLAILAIGGGLLMRRKKS